MHRRTALHILNNVFFSDTAHGIAMGERARQLKRRTHSTTELQLNDYINVYSCLFVFSSFLNKPKKKTNEKYQSNGSAFGNE